MRLSLQLLLRSLFGRPLRVLLLYLSSCIGPSASAHIYPMIFWDLVRQQNMNRFASNIMEKIRAHIRSHNKMINANTNHEYCCYHDPACYYAIHDDNIYILTCRECRPLKQPKINFTIVELCTFRLSHHGACVACLRHRIHDGPNNTMFEFSALCGDCYQQTQMAQTTFPMKILLTCCLPLLSEIAAIIMRMI